MIKKKILIAMIAILFAIVTLVTLNNKAKYDLEKSDYFTDKALTTITNEPEKLSSRYKTKRITGNFNKEEREDNPFTPFNSSQELGDWVSEQSPLEAYEYWNELYANNKIRKLRIVSRAFATTLRKDEDYEVYEDIQKRIGDPKETQERKEVLIFILSQAATSEAMNILVDEILLNPQHNMKKQILDAIYDATNVRWGGKYYIEMTPILENAWMKTQDDSTLSVLALSIAKLGSPSGLELMIEEMSANDESMFLTSNAISQAVMQAMKEVRNPDAIPYLSSTFLLSTPESDTFFATGHALASMGNVKATNVLLTWAMDAEDDFAESAEIWLNQVRDPESLRLLRTVVENKEIFRSEIIRKKIEDIVSARQEYK